MLTTDGRLDDGEEPIGGVTLKLLDAEGNDTGLRATTNSDGQYKFSDLAPGTYGVMEVQPTGWLDGKDLPGDRGGTADPRIGQDLIVGALLDFGVSAANYNFGELKPASLSGRVHTTSDFDCGPEHDTGPIEGVQVDLLDANGTVLATTRTDANGRYRFHGLRPGSYAVREQEIDYLFDAGAHAGGGNGNVIHPNRIGEIVVRSGDVLVNYDFCEYVPATISGYVFQDGGAVLEDELPADLSEIRDGVRTADDTPIAGVVLELRQGFSGEPLPGNHALPGKYRAEAPIRTMTDANGYYEFSGLPTGNYAIVQVQPDGYVDSIDTPGTAGGIAINAFIVDKGDAPIPLPGQDAVLDRLQQQFGDNVIARVLLDIGSDARENNFSEIATAKESLFPPLEDPPPPVAPPVFPSIWFSTPAILPPQVRRSCSRNSDLRRRSGALLHLASQRGQCRNTARRYRSGRARATTVHGLEHLRSQPGILDILPTRIECQCPPANPVRPRAEGTHPVRTPGRNSGDR